MEAAKGFFRVLAGVVPGQPMADYGQQWSYTSSDYEKDCATPQDQETIFTKRMKEAHMYAMTITDPSRVNWVRVDFLWV